MIFGLRFSSLDRAQVGDAVTSQIIPTGHGPRIVCTANLDHIVQLIADRDLRAAYEAAWLVTADGMPVFAYARLRREPVPSRVTGSDLVTDLLQAKLRPGRHRCFFVASTRETEAGIHRLMADRGFEKDEIGFAVPPFGFEADEAYSASLEQSIRDHGTTHLFLGVGAPKSEIWTDRHRSGLGDCYVLNVGAGLDYVCGVRHRAPVWMQQIGMEWAWRVGSEPRRLFWRYFVRSWRFFGAIRRDLRRPPLAVPR